MAIKFGGWQASDDGILDFVSGWVFLQFAHHTVDIAGGSPIPAVFDSLRLTNGTGGGVDVTVRISIVCEVFFGGGERKVGSANVGMFEVEWASAKSNFLLAIFFYDVNDDV